jgi:para-nitrobenzyl esterase
MSFQVRSRCLLSKWVWRKIVNHSFWALLFCTMVLACESPAQGQFCGDGILDPDEECDGDTAMDTSASLCRADCTLQRCGDGIIDEGESCDDGEGLCTLAPSACQHLRIESGIVIGTEDSGAIGYKGIPYAQPPIGELRWKAPQAVAPWTEALAATQYPPFCPQPDNNLGEVGGQEDCLYLNVWTPAMRDPAEKLPVMVFIHGGGNFLGSSTSPLNGLLNNSSSRPLYEGQRLATRGQVLVVTFNYRLGALGFLTHPGLIEETGFSGNYGLMDQIEVLKWVQRNIEVFGGDPDRVLLFGQSGGGRDVCLLVSSPVTQGLFSRAAMHSIPCGNQPYTQAVETRNALLAEMNCLMASDQTTPFTNAEQMACMRGKEPLSLVNAEASQPLGLASGAFRPTIDGEIVTGVARSLFATGDFQHMPIVVGNNALEYAHRWPQLSAEQYPAFVTAIFGSDAPAVMNQYPLSRADFQGDAGLAFSTLMSDRNAVCPSKSLVGSIANNQPKNTYYYQFQQALSTEDRKADGVYHTTELLYLFQHMGGDVFSATEDERLTEEAMLKYWTRFADTGVPSAEGYVEWQPHEAINEYFLGIQSVPSMDQNYKDSDCAFWGSL